MGATRPASGIKAKVYTLLNKDSQTALITCLSVSLSLIPDARRVAPIRARNALAQQSFTWLQICFLTCKSDRNRYH